MGVGAWGVSGEHLEKQPRGAKVKKNMHRKFQFDNLNSYREILVPKIKVKN